MTQWTRRDLITAAAAMGATVAWGKSPPGASRVRWIERRALFPQGVASGDPGPDSVLLWTRVEAEPSASAVALTVELAEDEAFERVVTSAPVHALAAADHTCRVLVGGLQPARTYWYRFSDANGHGSRIGRTMTAPHDDDPRPVRFAFVSCQNVCEGAQNAYRRMIFEDERAATAEQLAFVLHLGDFVYEVVEYPEDVPGGRRYDRRIRDVVRYPQGEKVVSQWRVPVSLADYRVLYRAYLQDPDLQDARARFPFVSMWDNHEFSWQGWQSFQAFGGKTRPAQTRKVAANQAWFEYQPARVRHGGSPALDRFAAPAVRDVPIERLDEQGLGQEPNNLAAINSLVAYRTLRWGKLLDLLITDQHSYGGEYPGARGDAPKLVSDDFPELIPEEVLEALDRGRTYGGGKPPATLRYGAVEVANFRRDEAPYTVLGAEQKAWFLERLRGSRAAWKVWGNSLGTFDWRADPQNLPRGVGKPWPGAGYACMGGGDWGSAYSERAEIYDAVRDAGITGFVTVAGDRHSFWAGFAAKALPPAAFEPVGVAFITGSISAVGIAEANEHSFPKDHPLRALYVADVEGRPQPTINLLMHHGVRACLEYQKTGDARRARAASNPDLAPHLTFLDMGGHGYATVKLTSDAVECAFVCIPRPIERSEAADGGPLRYRVVHRTPMWRPGERPRLEQRVVDGNPELSL